MTLKKKNGTSIEVELGQTVFFISLGKIEALRVQGITINLDGIELFGNGRLVYVDSVFTSQKEANIVCLEEEVATLKNSIDTLQRKLSRKFSFLQELKGETNFCRHE